MGFKVTRDEWTPALRALAGKLRSAQPILQAMGEELVGITKRAFSTESLRVGSWAAVKKTDGAALRKSGALLHSIRITRLTGGLVDVGTDRVYAGWQQFGTKPYMILPQGKKALYWPGAEHPVKKVNHPGIPARPFFPFLPDGSMGAEAQRKIEAVGMAKARALCRAAGIRAE